VASGESPIGPARIADSQAELSGLALFLVFQLYRFSIRKDVNANFPARLACASSSSWRMTASALCQHVPSFLRSRCTLSLHA